MNTPFLAARLWSSAADFLLTLAAFSLLWTAITLARRWGDRNSIVENLLRQGARLVSMKRIRRCDSALWSRNERYYQVRYHDRNRWEHTAVCKTGEAGDVFYADDKVTGPVLEFPPSSTALTAKPVRPLDLLPQAHSGDPAQRIAELEAENRRLQDELKNRRQS
jgi:hypothetical protein